MKKLIVTIILTLGMTGFAMATTMLTETDQQWHYYHHHFHHHHHFRHHPRYR